MTYTLTKEEAQLTAKCLDELILLWDQHNIEHSSIYYDIINIIVKLKGFECDNHKIDLIK